MIENADEVKAFLEKIALNNTVVFTNGNASYISTLINNLLVSYKRFNNSQIIGVFCSDLKAFDIAKQLDMVACYVNIPRLKVNNAYESKAGEDYYYRLCYIKIILIKFCLDLGYSILYIDPDMSFNKNCIETLVKNNHDLTFAKYLYNDVDRPFLNSNIMIARPCSITKCIFDVEKDLEYYLSPEGRGVGDETYLTDKICTYNYTKHVTSLNIHQFPAGGDSHLCNKDDILMYHANCFIGLANKINYLKRNDSWYVKG